MKLNKLSRLISYRSIIKITEESVKETVTVLVVENSVGEKWQDFRIFDTLEWTFVEKTLSFYNFGESIKSWIKLFHTNITSCIQNNGWSSDFFHLGRGVRLGCHPIAIPLYFMCRDSS